MILRGTLSGVPLFLGLKYTININTMLENVSYFMGKDGFNWFVGVVEDRLDPEHCGRVRVRALGYHSEDETNIPTKDLPWASVMMPVTAGGNSGIGFSPHFLIEGTWVVGFFRDPAKQEPIIMGALPGINSSDTTNFTVASTSAVGGTSKKGGFKDPNNKYPTSKYIDKADTNLLGQEFVSEHVSNSVKIATEEWSTASGVAQQPATTQSSAKYPYNHVLETESGHYIEFDDTSGNERIHIYHTKGTFIEIDPTGNVVIKTVGNVTNIVAGNMDTYVKGNYSLSVDGNMDVYTAKNLTEKVDGNRKTTITGTETLAITGNVGNTLSGTLTENITGATIQNYKNVLTTKITMAASIKSDLAMVIGGSTISFN